MKNSVRLLNREEEKNCLAGRLLKIAPHFRKSRLLPSHTLLGNDSQHSHSHHKSTFCSRILNPETGSRWSGFSTPRQQETLTIFLRLRSGILPRSSKVRGGCYKPSDALPIVRYCCCALSPTIRLYYCTCNYTGCTQIFLKYIK